MDDRLRILIVRLSAIGDLVHGLPVLVALRRQFPQATLGWVAEARPATLLAGHPALDKAHMVPRGWLKRPRTVMAIRRELRAMRYDVAIDLQGLSKSALLAWLSGAKRRIGFASPDGREISPWLNNERVLPNATHVIDRNLELLRALGIERCEAQFDLPRLPDVESTTSATLAQLDLAPGFIAMSPGAGWPSKLWPPARFAATARVIYERCGLRSLIVWGGTEEHSWAETIVAAAGPAALLAPTTNLVQLTSLTRRARLFIASDTGPLHIAAAVGTPCIGMFGPMPAERNGPFGQGHIALEAMRMTGSSRERRSAPPVAMEAISVEMVCRAAQRLLALERKAA